MTTATKADRRYLDLLLSAANPASTELSTDELAKDLGIDECPSPAAALKHLEEVVLAPVENLGGSQLHKWQM
jgi:hypothetical protein